MHRSTQLRSRPQEVRPTSVRQILTHSAEIIPEQGKQASAVTESILLNSREFQFYLVLFYSRRLEGRTGNRNYGENRNENATAKTSVSRENHNKNAAAVTSLAHRRESASLCFNGESLTTVTRPIRRQQIILQISFSPAEEGEKQQQSNKVLQLKKDIITQASDAAAGRKEGSGREGKTPPKIPALDKKSVCFLFLLALHRLRVQT